MTSSNSQPLLPNETSLLLKAARNKIIASAQQSQLQPETRSLLIGLDVMCRLNEDHPDLARRLMGRKMDISSNSMPFLLPVGDKEKLKKVVEDSLSSWRIEDAIGFGQPEPISPPKYSRRSLLIDTGVALAFGDGVVNAKTVSDKVVSALGLAMYAVFAQDELIDSHRLNKETVKAMTALGEFAGQLVQQAPSR